MQKIKSFTDLTTWKTAHLFVLEIYKVNKSLPREETYALSSQIRRAAVSITSNIAEGFSRRTAQDKSHFYITALSSLGEVQNQLLICKDLKYITEVYYYRLFEQSITLRRLLNGLIKSARTKK